MVQKVKTRVPCWLILGLALAFLLRLPSIFEPYSYGDECIYLTLGQAIRKGLLLYRDIHDNKPPLLYLFAGLTGNLFWFRFLLIWWSLLTIVFFSQLAKLLFPKEEKLVKISTLIFAIASSLPLFEGEVANAEVFMILPTILGAILILSNSLNFKKSFLAGILFSFSVLFKVPAVFDFAAILFFLIVLRPKKDFPLLILGFIIPLLITFVYFWSRGALNQYLTAAFFQNLPYLSSWSSGAKVGGMDLKLLTRFLILLGFLAGLFWQKRQINPFLFFTLAWLALSLFGATLSGRPYPHYLVQVLPSLCLLLGVFWLKLKPKEHFLISFSLAAFLFSLFYFQFWLYPVFAPYKNFFLFATKTWSQKKYFSSFEGPVIRNYQLAEFITTHTLKNEKVFVWGDSPCVYALANRLPVGRYTASYHLIDFNGFEEVATALEKEKPGFIIDLHNEGRPFLQLSKLLFQKYVLYKNIGGAEIFRLIRLTVI